jgi:hypothetical protein
MGPEAVTKAARRPAVGEERAHMRYLNLAPVSMSAKIKASAKCCGFPIYLWGMDRAYGKFSFGNLGKGLTQIVTAVIMRVIEPYQPDA